MCSSLRRIWNWNSRGVFQIYKFCLSPRVARPDYACPQGPTRAHNQVTSEYVAFSKARGRVVHVQCTATTMFTLMYISQVVRFIPGNTTLHFGGLPRQLPKQDAGQQFRPL
ncbi:hypothetical protein SEMRO_2403_G326371.1 [Seminavis robusta]|uniref:Uncharacterized protein n=1 Tax=Seminavis robusta TaxID=568900 RepID=A0A9N8HZW4_9STRA|nr:hypothetical protein SEMRO_2403_G326371.1 [Seminavis robusta]|eukprot:Sro2403_g326371.1  (111) ;mRNA; r:274-606